MHWIDTHCHLDAFGDSAEEVRQNAREQGVGLCVYPAVQADNFDAVRMLAHRTGDACALGIHPLYVPQATETDLLTLERQLRAHRDDPHLVAVGEIGLDFFVPALCTEAMRSRQLHFYTAQLALAHRFDLPVLLHVRKSADQLLKPLRQLHRQGKPVRGIAHAFNGSLQQAQQFIDLGFKLGFGGACTYSRARHLHRLLRQLPRDAVVLETDAPDMLPAWLYTPAAQREAGIQPSPNSPAQLPRIADSIARLLQLPLQTLQRDSHAASVAALPALATLPVLPIAGSVAGSVVGRNGGNTADGFVQNS